jgi:multidrug transporter EmrE-like cation transporter
MRSGRASGQSGQSHFGIALFGESAGIGRLVCVVRILAGIVGLKIVD